LIRLYLTLTKPGILFGNALTMIAGFFLAAKGQIDLLLFLASLLGILLVMASSCVINQWIDKKADAEMTRTRRRPLVTGSISDPRALIFAFFLLSVGVLVFSVFTNMVALTTALFGFAAYVGLYSTLKYYTAYGTLIGSVSGAMPPVVGYTAVTGALDWGALALFCLLVCWQMPHFFAIGIYRKGEYLAAQIPIWPIARGMNATKWQMLFYIVGFAISLWALLWLQTTYVLFTIGMSAFSIGWIVLMLQGWKKGTDDTRWAYQMFLFSLIVITAFSMGAVVFALLEKNVYAALLPFRL
jgi:protoheme IX farnesyltransferase